MRLKLLILFLFPSFAWAQTFPPGTSATGLNFRYKGDSVWFQRTADNKIYKGYPQQSIVTDTSSIIPIYNKKGWVDMSDFVGSSAFYADGGQIMAPASNSDVLRVNTPAGADIYTLSYDYHAINGTLSTSGLGLGFKSANVSADLSFKVIFNETSRKIDVFSYIDNTTTSSTQVLPTYTPGDFLRLVILNRSNNYTIILYNLTKGTNISRTFTVPFAPPYGQIVQHNTGYPSVYNSGTGTSYAITRLYYAVNYRQGGSLVLNNSITYGATAGTYKQRYANLIGAKIDAGPGDNSSHMLLRLPEIQAIHAKTVYINDGTNDADLATFMANLEKVVAALENSGSRVVVMAPPPNNTRSMQPFRDAIQARYPRQFIDLYTPLLASTGTNLNPAYDSGDGVHPNTAGHALMASIIMASPLYKVETDYAKLDSSIYVNAGSGGGSNPTPIVAQPNTIIRADATGNLVGNGNASLFVTDGSGAVMDLRSGPVAGKVSYSGVDLLNGATAEGYTMRYTADRKLQFKNVQPSAKATFALQLDSLSRIVWTNTAGQVNYFEPNNYDGPATYVFGQANFNEAGWYSKAFVDPTTNTVKGWFNYRTGTMDLLGGIFKNGVEYTTPTALNAYAYDKGTIDAAFGNYYPKAYIDANYKKIDSNGNTNWPRRTITTQGNVLELSDDNTSWFWIHSDGTGSRISTPATLATDGSGNRSFTQTTGGSVIP